MASKIVSIPLAQISIEGRLRSVDPDWAAGLALSIEQVGLHTPVLVAKAGDGYRLVAGAHRFEAVKSLGWEKIDASIVDGNQLELRLQEIDENLFRRELNALDRATFLAERHSIYEELHPETKKGAAGAAVRWHASEKFSFASDTAEKLGLSERSIQLSIARYRNINADVRQQINGTWIANKGNELDALARLSPAEQKKAVKLVLREKDPLPSIAAAARKIKGTLDPVNSDEDKALQKLMALWRDATAAIRGNFVAWLDEQGELGGRKKKAA